MPNPGDAAGDGSWFQTMAIRLILTAVAFVAFSTVAHAQNINSVLNIFGTLMQRAIVERARADWSRLPQQEQNCIDESLQNQGQSIASLAQQGLSPADPRISNLRRSCRVALAPPVAPAPTPIPNQQGVPKLSNYPTFDCSTAQSPSGRIICLVGQGAMADWELTSAYLALKFSLPESSRSKFIRAHDDWPATLKKTCKLPPGQDTFSTTQQQCVLGAFRKRAQAYRSHLQDDALAEARLTPEQHAQIQQALSAMGLLNGEIDGQFGEVTRAAIKRYQVQSGFAEADFLTSDQRSTLLGNSRVAQGPSQPQLETQPITDPQVQCRSQDANARLIGCTKVIDAKGAGYELALADALDARCWAYNQLSQYDRGLIDCKAALALKPKYFYAFNNMGTSLLGLKDIPDAIAAFSKAIDLKSNFIFPYIGRGHALLASGKTELAKMDFEYALSIDPNNGDAQEGFRTAAKSRTPIPPSEGVPPGDFKRIKQARIFFNDARDFIATQTALPDITGIASEAANLQIAIDRLDEDAAARSSSNLSNALKPIAGYDMFITKRKSEREQEEARKLADAKAEGAKNFYFIDTYIKQNLGDPKTGQLLALRAKLDQSVKKNDVDEITAQNTSVHAYVDETGISKSYEEIVRTFMTPPLNEVKPDANDLGLTDISKFLVVGPQDDIVLLYNASPVAPSVWKNVRGDVVFQKNSASLCFAHPVPVPLSRYVEQTIIAQGAHEISSNKTCDVNTLSSTIDILAFQRGELLKQRREYILALAKLVEGGTFNKFGILSDYASEIEKRQTLSLKIESDVQANLRVGYGVIKTYDVSTACLVPPADPEQASGLKQLIGRNKYLIAPSLSPEWEFIQTTEDLAYRGLQRHQCGLVAAEESVLHNIMQALVRDKANFVFAPVWFSQEDLSQATFDIRDKQEQEILKQHEEDRKTQEAEALEQKRRQQREQDKTQLERQLRAENNVKAQGLLNEVQDFIQKLAQNRTIDNRFPAFSSWLAQRFAEQWETFQISSDVADYGTAQWNGRALEAVMIRSIVQQKNRIIGKYSRDCFVFGFINDVEFAMEREFVATDCDKGQTAIKKWTVGNQFKSEWNVN